MKSWWIFTFGCSRDIYGDNAGKAVKIAGTYQEARSKMCEKYGDRWCAQYSADEWEKIKNRPSRYWEMEEIIEAIS